MSFRVQHKFDRETASLLKDFFFLVSNYVQIHPVPGMTGFVLELLPANAGADCFVWRWDWEKSIDQMAWQAIFDRWLHDRFSNLVSKGIQGVLIHIMKDEKKENDASPPKTGLIQGEGLASFHAVLPKFKMEKLVIPCLLREKIINTISIIKHIDLIYTEWGFSEVDSQPRLILNFFGPPGTGKTMAAHSIADALGKKILIANFAEIESKYVGDSPKNLENIFAVARNEDAVLFFDEADSFLGKRLTSVSTSSDQAVNSLRSKLLQLLENHSGIVIFCTNLLKNYDKAFESRILRSLKFDLPDEECRMRLIRQMIPCKIPFAPDQLLDKNALQWLADAADGFSGREIKNAILQVLCKAASEGKTEFLISDFKDGFDSMKQEIESMKNERGEISRTHADKLEKAIGEKLKSGDFEVQKKTDSCSSEQSKSE